MWNSSFSEAATIPVEVSCMSKSLQRGLVMKELWVWPIHKFWTFSPQGWVLAVIWNVFELCHKPMPYAGKAFGVIIGKPGKRIK